MSLHKLTAGDGYTYLTRQVAALDATERGHVGLGDYYSQRGESPGAWAGAGLTGLGGVVAGQPVEEQQMKSLFGQGRHPDAARLEHESLSAGRSAEESRAAGALGVAFRTFSVPAEGLQARCAQEYAAINAARGSPPGAALPEEERARIRGELARAMFTETYGRPPSDARELSGFIAQASRPVTTAVAGFDLTFSPVKSVSALWALAPRAVAEQIEAAHAAAVADTLAWLERHACFTRLGHDGVRQVETTGLVAAAFTHRDSRAGDPDLHTHVAVSNKVQTTDGQWRALDGRVLYKANVAASERYNTVLEAALVDRLGVRFADRSGGDSGKRTVREILGIDSRLLSVWSSRRRAIDVRRGHLAAAFQREHGRTPTASEAIALAQQATLETREAKHEPRSLAEQRVAWRQEALGVLGGPAPLNRMLADVLRPRRNPAPDVTETWVLTAAGRVLATVAAQRATWQFWHVRAEAERVVRAAALVPGDVDAAVHRVTQAALSPALSIPLGGADPAVEPPELRRSDGTSVYSVAGAQLYTCQAVLDAEARLLTAAGRTDGRRVDPTVVELALLETTANGAQLNPGQAQLVRELAGSGARVQLAIAPAGTGKTTSLAVLSRAWRTNGGRVLGLAPSAVAATGLREAVAAYSDTVAKLVWALDADRRPDWVADVGPGTLVIVDEAGMAGTLELARVVEFVLGRGGSVRLVGDDRQLASVAAGGVLREIAATHGAVTLTELVRFADPAEAAATVAIRDGDTIGLGFYLDSGRVHVGDPTTCAEQAYLAWAADRERGVDALLLAATRNAVLMLNQRARADRLTRLREPVGLEAILADGTRASAGDMIITRANDRALPITAGDWVKNGDRWTVSVVHADGSLAAIQADTGRRVTLPAAYVSEHVQLGYATTVHGAQGVTADASHTVLDGTESRQLLYVALSRGSGANHLYLATVGDGDPHSIVTPAAVSPPTATDLLASILARDGAQLSATGAHRTSVDPAGQLNCAANWYVDALRFAAIYRLGAETAEELEDAAERLWAGLTGAAAWPALRGHLALLALTGGTPLAVLRSAVEARELQTAGDPAAVIDWRLHVPGPVGPLPWLAGIPAALTADPHWGPYLIARADHLAACAARVAAATAVMTAATAPAWARHLLGPDHASLRAELAIWRAALAVPDNDRRHTGPSREPATERRHQARLDQAVTAACPARDSSVWVALADGIDPRIRRDEHWPVLADRLAAAARAGLDAAGMFAAVAAQRPLPDDMPAAALWWRLAPHFAPATVAGAPGTAAPRPDWCATLSALLPHEEARAVLADPAWPALVAGVANGIGAGWSPADLLSAAVAGLRPAVTGDRTGLVEALVFRVAALTDPAPAHVDDPEPLPADLQPPDDAYLLPAVDVLASADFLATDVPPVEEEAPFDPDYDTPPPASSARWFTPDPFAVNNVSDPADDADYLLEQHFWATAVVGRTRLIELNAQAAAFFTARYPDSWARGYVQNRLGADLIGDPRFSPGYAPGGWTALVGHLRGLGATEDELLGAGLAQRARTGALIDRFRDRLVFPIHALDGAIVGFVARRNPSAADDGHAGPKYLNTPGTDLYRKGEHLFGLYETQSTLASGATPALVEGPLDAIAITLAGAGRTVGVATLGTALTDRQADLLGACISRGGPGVLVATDNDPAGQQAAERVFWQLTTRGDDPRWLTLPDGLDPADLFHREGPTALRTVIDAASSLADILLDARITAALSDRSTAVFRTAMRDVGAIIVALPPSRWLAHIDRVTEVLGLPPGTVHSAVLETQPITSSPNKLTAGPRQAFRTTPSDSDRHKTGQTGWPSSGTPIDLR
ncbi:toprim domain-containing protein [Blastococcus sp. KM273128]|uniref:MobF family relaxase n=1 Tax=Blastococcus sp. KM273128 TaxID=2570314 RepID=UPI001F3207D6|nr:MobF family relaxase [Blastococcus sp. KM273128]MCF6746552.1 toprim domain-containing protein [Blastococcus sp. KM273128]